MIEINNFNDLEKYINDFDVFIFDLDDTLYSEKDYVKSGFNAIGKEFSFIKDLSQLLWNAFINKKPAIDYVFDELNMSSKRDEALLIYRNHIPNIKLYDGVREFLLKLKKNKKIGIITDGRLEGQQAKIKALKLTKIVDKIIITDGLGGINFRKPNETAFIIIKEFFNSEYSKMCYIGDNINKDGVAPKKLGMTFFHFNNKDGLYR